jgi:hypothetical protein
MDIYFDPEQLQKSVPGNPEILYRLFRACLKNLGTQGTTLLRLYGIIKGVLASSRGLASGSDLFGVLRLGYLWLCVSSRV